MVEFVKNYGGIKGIDKSVNPLNSPPFLPLSLKNAERADDWSLQCRTGFRPATGVKGIGFDLGEGADYKMRGLSRYVGTLGEELVGVSQYQPWTLDRGYMNVANANAYVVTATCYLNTATQTYKYKLVRYDTQAVLLDQDLGNASTEISTTYTLKQLKAAIDGVSGMTCTLSPYGTINGAVVGSRTIVLNAGHTAGNVFVGKHIEVQTGASQTTQYPIMELVGNTMKVGCISPYVTASNGWIVGIGLQSAASLPLGEFNIGIGSDYTTGFFWWRKISTSKETYNVAGAAGAKFFAGTEPNKQAFVGSQNCLYMPSTAAFYTHYGSFVPEAKYGEGLAETIPAGLAKYDGVQACASGLPPCRPTHFYSGGGGTLFLAGARYRWILTLEHKDAQGNIIESSPAGFYERIIPAGNETGITFTLGCDSDAWNLDTWPYTGGVGALRSARCSATVATTYAAGASITVSANHTLLPGQYVAAPGVGGASATADSFAWAKVVSITDTTIVLDTAVIVPGYYDFKTVAFRLWRTKSGGLKYYSAPSLFTGGRVADCVNGKLIDSTADASLGVEYLPLEKRADPFPPGEYVCGHQIGIVLSDGQGVYCSQLEQPEFTNMAANQFEVPMGRTGPITGIASDTDDMLAVFKETSYYNVVGDLDGGSYSILTVSDGDIGCVSHHTLVRYDKYLTGLSLDGPFRIQGGVLDTEFGAKVRTFFSKKYALSSAALSVADAIFFNDYPNNRLIMEVPRVSTALIGTDQAPPLTLVWDYMKKEWFDWGVPHLCNMQGGAAIASPRGFNGLYRATSTFTTSRLVVGFNPYIGNAPRQDDPNTPAMYTDCGVPVDWDLWFSWESLAEPSMNKELLEFKIWSFYNSLEITDTFTSFSLRLRVYQDFKMGHITNPSTPVTDRIMLIAPSTLPETTTKLSTKKGRSFVFRLSNHTSAGAVVPCRVLLTGIEFSVNPAYDKSYMNKGSTV